MKSRCFVKQCKENLYLLVISFMLALVCTVIASPGIMYADSYGRINFAYTIIDCIKKTLAGQWNAITAKSWLTVMPSFFISISRILTGDIVMYTFMQAFFFFLVSLLFVKRLNTHYVKVQYVLIAICPLYFAVSVYYEAGIGCVTGIVMQILLISTVERYITRFDAIVHWIMVAGASFITFGYRANAFTVIPPVFVLIVLMTKQGIVRKIYLMISVMVGLFGAILLPGILHIDTMSSYSTGFVWEMLTTIQNTAPEKQAEYVDYLDEIGGAGSTEEGISLSSVSTVNSFLGRSRFNMLTLSEEGNGAIVLRKYFEMWTKEPEACLQTKWEFVKKTIGIKDPINCWEYGYNIYDKMDELGFRDWIPREIFVNSYLKFHQYISILRYPWFIYTITFLMIIWTWIKKDNKRQLYSCIYAIAIFYYGSFVLNTQSFELRYFYPSLYLMSIMDTAIFMDLIATLHRKHA